MRRATASWKASTLVGLAAAMARLSRTSAAEIVVLDPEGRPASDVAVVCARGAIGTGLTDERGKSTLPTGCREAECMRGGFVMGRVRIAGDVATCRLVAPLLLHGEARVSGPPEMHSVILRSSGDRGVVQTARLEEPSRFRLEPVVPGSYLLEIVRREDLWSCVSELGALPAGEHEIVVSWREPLEITGVALDPEERAFAGVLLRVDYGGQSAGPGSTRCEMDLGALDVVSGKDGRFRAFVDPARAYRIIADDAWRPATIRIDAGR